MTDLAELFARDPEHLTKSDIAELIAYYREARQEYVQGAKQAGNAKKLASGALKPALKDLNLDL